MLSAVENDNRLFSFFRKSPYQPDIAKASPSESFCLVSISAGIGSRPLIALVNLKGLLSYFQMGEDSASFPKMLGARETGTFPSLLTYVHALGFASSASP